MSTLREIQTAIGGLSVEEREVLLAWLLDRDRQAWDEQITQDFGPGGSGGKWLDEIDGQIRSGQFQPME